MQLTTELVQIDRHYRWFAPLVIGRRGPPVRRLAADQLARRRAAEAVDDPLLEPGQLVDLVSAGHPASVGVVWSVPIGRTRAAAFAVALCQVLLDVLAAGLPLSEGVLNRAQPSARHGAA